MDIRDLLDVTFEVPDRIREGLKYGLIFREGGVVRRDTGEIEMFLRESSGLSQELATLRPCYRLIEPSFSVHGGLGYAGRISGSVQSALSDVISKLNKIQASLQEIHKKLDRVLAEVQWISRKLDLEIVGKMKSALEIASTAVFASSMDLRRQGLADARNRLIESANHSKLFLEELITTKKYLSRADLFDLSYRTWAVVVLPSCSVNCFWTRTR